jgi:hypothetical protein
MSLKSTVKYMKFGDEIGKKLYKSRAFTLDGAKISPVEYIPILGSSLYNSVNPVFESFG